MLGPEPAFCRTRCKDEMKFCVKNEVCGTSTSTVWLKGWVYNARFSSSRAEGDHSYMESVRRPPPRPPGFPRSLSARIALRFRLCVLLAAMSTHLLLCRTRFLYHKMTSVGNRRVVPWNSRADAAVLDRCHVANMTSYIVHSELAPGWRVGEKIFKNVVGQRTHTS